MEVLVTVFVAIVFYWLGYHTGREVSYNEYDHLEKELRQRLIDIEKKMEE